MCLFSRLFIIIIIIIIIIIAVVAVVVVGIARCIRVITFRHIYDNNELTKMDSGGK